MENKRKKKILTIVSLLATGLIYAVFLSVFLSINVSGRYANIHRLSTDYTISIDDTVYTDVNLDEFFFDPLPKGSVVKMTGRFPYDINDSSILILSVLHSDLRLIVDGREYYHYGDGINHLYGYGDQHIQLKQYFSGKEFTIVQTVMENGEVSSIEVPQVAPDGAKYYHSLATSMVFPIMVDFSIIFVSLLFAGVALVFLFGSQDMIRLIFLAIAVFFVGMWEFCHTNIFAIFSDNLALRGYIEYLSFYSAPLFFTMYFSDDCFYKEKTWRRYVYVAILSAQVVFVCLSIFLHITDIRHLPAMLLPSHILLITSLTFVTYMSVRAVINKLHTHKAFLVGFGALLTFAARDLANFVIYYYIRHNSGRKYHSYMLIGVFLFATSMFVDFFALLRKRTAAEARSEVYNRMAHTDMMTGLSNRRKCEEELNLLAFAKDPFALISFDLNDLKKTNDNYGHAEGDKLLTDFSKLLLEVFPYDSLVCRTGGDEFIAVIKDLTTASPDAILESLEVKKNELNKGRTPLPLSYACGYCISNEIAMKQNLSGRELVDEVLRVSDARMYGNKALIKGQM